jgi:hypothetical protein
VVTTHDGALTMQKVSRLLNSEKWTHCLAHVLHLLLMTDGISGVADLMAILKKCKGIVTTLHFKGALLQQESQAQADAETSAKFLQMISEAMKLTEADDRIEPNVDDSSTSATTATNYSSKLQNEVPTRWNSALSMMQSLLQKKNEVIFALKKINAHEKLLKQQEWLVIQQTTSFLQNFADLTEMVSGHYASPSLVAILRCEIKSYCEPHVADVEELVSLKRKILKNIDHRLPLSDEVITSVLLDPTTKNLQVLDMSHEKKVAHLKKLLPKDSQPPESSHDAEMLDDDSHLSKVRSACCS